MVDIERVVIRSSWLAAFSNVAPIIVVFVLAQIWETSLAGLFLGLLVIVVITVVVRYSHEVELTPSGLNIRWFRTTRVPWQHIGSVEMASGLGSHAVQILDSAQNRSHQLPAPRGAFGVGKKDAAKARDLIEDWWLTYRGMRAPTHIQLDPPRDSSGRPIDPWLAPPKD